MGLLAEIAFEQELTPHHFSREAIWPTVKRLGHGSKWTKRWITSPDLPYAQTVNAGPAR